MLLWDGMKMALAFHFTFCTGTPMPGGSWVCLDAVLFQLPDVRHDADPNCGTSHRCAPRKKTCAAVFVKPHLFDVTRLFSVVSFWFGFCACFCAM